MKVWEVFTEKFSTKVFAVFAVFILITSASFTLFFINSQGNSLYENLTRKGRLLAEILAYNARIGVFSESAEMLEVPIEGVFEQEGVLKAAIFNAEGRLLATRETPGKGNRQTPNKGIEETYADAIKRLKVSPVPFSSTDDSTMDFWAPVMAGAGAETEESLFFGDSGKKESIIGFVTVTVDKEILNRQLRALLFKSIFLGIIFILIGSGVTYFVVKGITEPLNRLTEEVKVLERGGPVETVPVETRDEVGKLAQSFNSMAETLKQREEEKALLEDQLRHAQKMEAIGTLAGGIAHDFNNILTTIIGYGHLLTLQIGENEALKHHVGQILVSAERAATLTKSLLAFSRKQLIKLQGTDLNHVITSVQKLLARLIREDIEIKLNLSTERLTLMADPGQIDQVLMNLVTNARDAMPQGGTITIATESVAIDRDFFKGRSNAKPGYYARLSVSDTGSGMNEETRKRIFDPFFTTKEVGKGTGLGLSMIYGIIKQHEGYVDLESEEGKGTTFMIYLPLSDIEVEIKEEEHKDLPQGGTETILIAEDDNNVRKLAKEVLERSGYTVIQATNGEDALAKFEEHKDAIDLFLLDVVMPKKNGKEVWDQIRRLKPDSKSIFVSGYAYDIIHEKGVIKDEINFISKPISPEELLRNVREVLDV